MPITPPRLQPGDTLRIIAPSRSLSIIAPAQREIANRRFEDLGLKLSFGKHVEESDLFRSSSIESRIEDLHSAFADPGVKAILTVIGGFNCNQLLRHIDYDLVGRNPKILCGYSDITALQNAIFARTGLVTYSGPHYSTFAMKQRFEFTLDHFKRCLFSDAPIELQPSELWSDDPWFLDQDKRDFIPNPGYLVLNEGKAEGTVLGANLCTFQLLHGTEFMPSLKDSILFIEEDELCGSYTDVNVERDLQSIIHQPGFDGVRGIVIGRFQKASQMNEAKLRQIVNKRELARIPIIAGVDFGHTDPYITFPIGGSASIEARSGKARIVLTRH
jgi:muramoyltetrapeptide carboxypeptidase